MNPDWVDLLMGNMTPDLIQTLRPEDIQVFFEVGDRVFFHTDSDRVTGTLEKLNPKRALVRCGADKWTVPYVGLDHVCKSTASNRRPRATRLKEVATQARALMDLHGLEKWGLHFQVAQRKLGECRARQKLILLSRPHAVNGPPAQVTDTILHEIAHALAGPEAGHGPIWKAIARQIGAMPKSRAPESDNGRHHREDARKKFRHGDAVVFLARGENRSGTIIRMNPKRAKIACGDSVWLVPYTKLKTIDHLDSNSRKG